MRPKLTWKRLEWLGNLFGEKSRVSVRVTAKEGVALLMQEGLWVCVQESKEVYSRLL